ncbi:MAG: hypothetical protein ACU836_00780 [Gammaproteobacteria bacterium]
MSCGEDDEDQKYDDRNEHDDEEFQSRPRLTGPSAVTTHAGEELVFAVTATDCAERTITIEAEGLPEGATIDSSIDPLLHLPKAVITWTPPMDSEGARIKIVLKAIAHDPDTGESVASKPKNVVIRVLPAMQMEDDDLDTAVKDNIVGIAHYSTRSNSLHVYGQVIWNKAMSEEERDYLVRSEDTATISDANTGAILGEAEVRSSGKWRAVLPMGRAIPPCAIDVTYHGKAGSKTVKGASDCEG